MTGEGRQFDRPYCADAKAASHLLPSMEQRATNNDIAKKDKNASQTYKQVRAVTHW